MIFMIISVIIKFFLQPSLLCCACERQCYYVEYIRIILIQFMFNCIVKYFC